ncbi:pilus assembly protein PilM [candidate division KSB1 bacterium]|nr:pilus assembly protein PilM [candidate division KSB1 bacterium]
MTAVDGQSFLGLHLAGKNLRVIEAENNAGRVAVRSVSERLFQTPFDLRVIGAEESIPAFAGAINQILDQKSIRTTTAALALDRRMLLFKKIKIDRGLSETQIRDQIEWEIEQLLIVPRSNYNIGHERLGGYGNQYERLLIAAIRKDVIRYLNDIFVRTPLTLKTVDIDLMASIRALYASEGKRPDMLSALVDFNEYGIDLTLIKDGKYAASTEMSVQSGLGSRVPEGGAEQIAKAISDELNQLIDHLSDELVSKSIESIYLSGDQADVEVIPHLQGLQETADIRFADPFENFSLYLEAETDALVKNKPEKFLATAGMIV